MTERTLGLDHLSALALAPAAFVDAAADAGCGSVSLRTIQIAGGEAPWASSPAWADELRAAVARTGVTVHAIEAVAVTPELGDRLDTLRAQLELGAELGASSLYSFGDDPELGRCADTFAALASLAREYGLRTLLEPMPYRVIATLPQASELISRVSPDSGLIVDTLHARRGGTNPADLADLPSGQLAVLQLCDAPALAPEAPSPSGLHPLLHEARFARRIPGAGELPLAAFAAAMPDDAIITIEAPSPGADAFALTALAAATRTCLTAEVLA